MVLKIKKIEDTRKGFIYEAHGNIFYVYRGLYSWKDEDKYYHWWDKFYGKEYNHHDVSDINPEYMRSHAKLIGRINTTHKIKDNKIIKINRGYFDMDDVVEIKDYDFLVLIDNICIDVRHTDPNDYDDHDYAYITVESRTKKYKLRDLKKLGTIEIDYEFE
jgi:hypothetical protein